MPGKTGKTPREVNGIHGKSLDLGPNRLGLKLTLSALVSLSVKWEI